MFTTAEAAAKSETQGVLSHLMGEDVATAPTSLTRWVRKSNEVGSGGRRPRSEPMMGSAVVWNAQCDGMLVSPSFLPCPDAFALDYGKKTQEDDR